MYLGMVLAMFDTTTAVSKHPAATACERQKHLQRGVGVCIDDALSRPNLE